MDILCNHHLTITLKPEEKLVIIRLHSLEKTYLWRDCRRLFQQAATIFQKSKTVDIKFDVRDRINTVCPCCRNSTLKLDTLEETKTPTPSSVSYRLDWSNYSIIDDVLPVPFEDVWEDLEVVGPGEIQHTIPHTQVFLNFLRNETTYFHNHCLKKTLNQRLRGF